MKRINWIDYAKFFGITFVVVGHVNRGLLPSFNNEISLSLDKFIYSFHMPLFFFLSGFFVIDSLKKDNFIAKKLRSILYPYALWSIIQGIIEVIFSKFKNTETSILDIFDLLHPRAQFWFLYALMMIFLFAFILYKLRCNIFIMLLVSIFLYTIREKVGDIFHLNYITNYFIYFCMGGVFNELNKYIKKDSSLINLLIFVTSTLLLFYFYSENKLLIALFGIIMVISFSFILSRFNINILLKIGLMTMPIYLMHIIFGSGLRIICMKLGLNNYYALLIVLSITSTLLPIITYSILYRLKATKYLF